MDDNPLDEAVYRAIEYGGAPVLHIPERAHIRPGTLSESMWDGLTATYWSEADR